MNLFKIYNKETFKEIDEEVVVDKNGKFYTIFFDGELIPLDTEIYFIEWLHNEFPLVIGNGDWKVFKKNQFRTY